MRMVFFCGKVSDEIGGGNETDPIFIMIFKKNHVHSCEHFALLVRTLVGVWCKLYFDEVQAMMKLRIHIMEEFHLLLLA